MKLGSESYKADLNFIILTLIIISAILFIFLLKSTAWKYHYSHDIVITDGVIYRSGESSPFTGRILDTLNNKIIVEYDVVNGLKNGEFFLSTLNGNFTVYGFMNNNKNVGTWQYFYESGQLESTGDFNNDEPIGKWIWYYQNGVKKCEGIYLKGQPEGRWVKFDEQSNPSMIINYERGEVVSEVKINKPKMV